VPVRNFADSGTVRTALGASDISAGPFTYVGLVKLQAGTGSAWIAAFQDASHFNAGNWESMGVENKILETFPGPGSSGGPEPPRSVWVLLAATKVATKSKVKYYVYRFDENKWVTAESTNEFTPTHTGTPAEIQLGRWNGTEQLKGLMAAVAFFNKVLSKAELEEMVTGVIKDWLKKSPVGMWMFNQKSVSEELKDATGNGADQSSIVGTTVSEEEPPIPYEGEEGKTVKVLKEGVLVNAKRWILKGGVLVNK